MKTFERQAAPMLRTLAIAIIFVVGPAFAPAHAFDPFAKAGTPTVLLLDNAQSATIG